MRRAGDVEVFRDRSMEQCEQLCASGRFFCIGFTFYGSEDKCVIAKK